MDEGAARAGSDVPTVVGLSRQRRLGAAVGPADVQPGARLGRYVVLSMLGAGGMGLVYRAYDPRLSREVAVKLLRVDAGGSAGASAEVRILREAQAMAQLSHPNVLPVYDVQVEDDSVFIAMECVVGFTLKEWVHHEDRTWRAIVDVLCQAGRGLAAAHKAGLVHRDFKPANVLVGKDGRARVMDFGLARELSRTRADSDNPTQPSITGAVTRGPITKAGAVVGTPQYMAPEQHRSEVVDASADQYAFCVAAWEALYGELPFADESVIDLLIHKAEGPPQPPTGGAVPAWIGQAIRRGLAPVRSDRWPSMGELVAALGRDPRRRRARVLRVGIAAGLGGLTLTTVMVAAGRRDEICAGGDDRLAQVWADPQRDALRTAITAVNVPYARQAFAGAEAGLDRYGAQWVSMYTEACRATQVRGAQASDGLDLRMACLERRRTDLRRTIETLSGDLDAGVVGRAVRAVSELPSLDACNDVAALRAEEPVAPGDRARADAIREALASARALEKAGMFAASSEFAAQARTDAMALEYGRLQSAALLQVGALALHEHAFESAEAAYDDAYYIAVESGDAVGAADAALGLSLVHVERSRVAEAQTWAKHARAWVGQLGSDDARKVRLELVLGDVEGLAGRYDRAALHFDDALALAASVLPPEHHVFADCRNRLGGVAMAQGDYALALEHFDTALQRRQESLGPDHPVVARELNNKAVALQAMGRAEEALSVLTRVVEIREAAVGKDHTDVARAKINLGLILAHLERRDEALAAYLTALPVLERTPDDPVLAKLLTNIGIIHSEANHPSEARAHFERALRLAKNVLGAEHPDVAIIHLNLGTTMADLGDTKAAARHYEQTITLTQAANGDPTLIEDAQRSLAELR